MASGYSLAQHSYKERTLFITPSEGLQLAYGILGESEVSEFNIKYLLASRLFPLLARSMAVLSTRIIM
jgi:hypothetical protein